MSSGDLQDPWYMQPSYLDTLMSSWPPEAIDWSSLMLRSDDEDEQPGNSRDWTVHWTIDLVQSEAPRGVQLPGQATPVNVAIITRRSANAFLAADAIGATGVGPSSPRNLIAAAARRRDTLGRRNKDCEPVYLCPICETTFTRKWSLEGHIKAHDDKEFACKIPGCKDRFNTKAHLKIHLKNRHHVS